MILPGGLTHLLQPLDKSLFKVFKQKYKEAIHEFKPTDIKKDKWTKLDVIKTATITSKQVFTTERIQNAFVDCGIEPFAPESTIEKLDQMRKKKRTNKEKSLQMKN